MVIGIDCGLRGPVVGDFRSSSTRRSTSRSRRAASRSCAAIADASTPRISRSPS